MVESGITMLSKISQAQKTKCFFYSCAESRAKMIIIMGHLCKRGTVWCGGMELAVWRKGKGRVLGAHD
jgi:hypothetical protein